ncbi:elongin-C-like [Toxorhynchites rutilus septentrionalis]|uniref:elongin-C-like n=1 Tax=Toxorhynchites rutilus septentrionalis TaxID=329112 RepID=UPI00247AE6D0|nr:elongin-C-like [Toxorhynchites rutilus septentrionalis]
MNKCTESKYSLLDCKGPVSEFIKLVSAEGAEFIVKRKHAFISDTIQAMLSGPGQFSETETNIIHFKEISSTILEKICEYLAFKHRYMNSLEEVPEFPISDNIVIELLMAADFLNI